MKKYVLLCILFLISATTFGTELKIYTEESPPLNFINKNGEVDGFSTDIVKEIQRRIGNTSKIEAVPWARAYHLATKEKVPNIMLYSTTFSEERRNLFYWVGPLFDNSWTFYSLSTNDIKINSLEDAKKVNKIGTYTSDVREQFLKKNGFENIASFRNTQNNILALKTGRTDLWITSTIGFKHIAEKEEIDQNIFKPVYKVKTVGLFIAFSKNTDKKIVEEWQNTYNIIKEDGTLMKICKKWNIDFPEYKIPKIKE